MRRVLIVDDEPIVANTLRLIFEKKGFEVRATYSADAALECAVSFNPELLVCDINMPRRSGLDLISEIDSAMPGCQILVLTGAYATLRSVREKGQTLRRPLSVLTKPCHPTDLLRQADSMLLPA